MQILLTVIYLLITTSAIILMKLGGNSISIITKGLLNFKIGYITLCGFVLYVISFLLWQKLLISFDLSYIVPITSGIIQILVLLAAYFIFNETITIQNVIGVLTVIVGIILITTGRK